MIRIKPTIRAHRIDKNGLVNVEISVSNERCTIYLLTGFKIRKDEIKSQKIVKNANSKNINLAIQVKISELSKKQLTIRNIDNISASALRRALTGSNENSETFIRVCMMKIEQCEAVGALKSKSLYNYTLNVINEFYPDVCFSEINLQFLKKLDGYLHKKGLKQNTISLLFRYVRAVFNEAINNEIIQPLLYPFRKFKIKTEHTAKRSLTVDELKKLSTIEGVHLDIFFLSFFLIGINIKDLLFAKKTQLVDGRLFYNRSKTGKLYSVKVHDPAMKIIEKYPGKILVLEFMEKRKRLDQFNKYINKHLQNTAKELNINKQITTYYARHSWATIAASIGASRDVISHALGHGNNTVTDTYIDFDLKKVDSVNLEVIKAIDPVYPQPLTLPEDYQPRLDAQA